MSRLSREGRQAGRQMNWKKVTKPNGEEVVRRGESDGIEMASGR